MFLVGWFAFAEPVGLSQWIACAIVVSAIALTPGRSIRSVAANVALEGDTAPVVKPVCCDAAEKTRIALTQPHLSGLRGQLDRGHSAAARIFVD